MTTADFFQSDILSLSGPQRVRAALKDLGGTLQPGHKIAQHPYCQGIEPRHVATYLTRLASSGLVTHHRDACRGVNGAVVSGYSIPAAPGMPPIGPLGLRQSQRTAALRVLRKFADHQDANEQDRAVLRLIARKIDIGDNQP